LLVDYSKYEEYNLFIIIFLKLIMIDLMMTIGRLDDIDSDGELKNYFLKIQEYLSQLKIYNLYKKAFYYK